MNFKLLRHNPYNFDKNHNQNFFYKIQILTLHHKKNCTEYKNFVNSFFTNKFEKIIDLPYLPSSVFKSFELKSIKNKDITKRMISSGTSGENSKILSFLIYGIFIGRLYEKVKKFKKNIRFKK